MDNNMIVYYGINVYFIRCIHYLCIYKCLFEMMFNFMFMFLLFVSLMYFSNSFDYNFGRVPNKLFELNRKINENVNQYKKS